MRRAHGSGEQCDAALSGGRQTIRRLVQPAVLQGAAGGGRGRSGGGIGSISCANRELDRAGTRVYANEGERLSEVRREERFSPVYTLCLYHGAEEWDGPRSLKDMMDFWENMSGHVGDGAWKECFADYPMRLVCANELVGCSGF